jgi:hypothetical protein
MLHPTLNIVQPPAVTQQKPPTGENASKVADGLTPAQIEVLLKAVPVFSLTDAGGQPIVSKVPDATKGVTAIFMSPGTAATALAQIKAKNAELAAKLKINPVSLWDIYKLATSETSPFLIQFVADPAEMDAAKPLLKEGRTVRVPLFVAKNKKDNGLLTINQKGMEAIPMFLSKKDLDAVLRKFAKPELLTEIATDVVDLEHPRIACVINHGLIGDVRVGKESRIEAGHLRHTHGLGAPKTEGLIEELLCLPFGE